MPKRRKASRSRSLLAAAAWQLRRRRLLVFVAARRLRHAPGEHRRRRVDHRGVRPAARAERREYVEVAALVGVIRVSPNSRPKRLVDGRAEPRAG